MIRRLAAAAGLVAIPAAASRLVVGRAADRLLDAPRTAAAEADLGPALDALGGEVVRLRSRDGLRLAGRWLPSTPAPGDEGDPRREADASGGDDASGEGDASAAGDARLAGWRPDPHEAILLLHGWSGSVAPDVVEYGPFLRRIAGVLGLDFRGHGGSDDAPTTFGLTEVEDVAGALAWLGERGVRRVALFGTSMGGITALASIVVLGDGTLASADVNPDLPAHDIAAPRPEIVAAAVESVPPEVTVPVANRMRVPFRRFLAARTFEAASRRVGGDIRATEPIRIVGLIESVPLLLIHDADDRTVPIGDGERLRAAAGPNAEEWIVPGADHSAGHRTDPAAYEARVGDFLRRAFVEARARHSIIREPVTDEVPDGGQKGD